MAHPSRSQSAVIALLLALVLVLGVQSVSRAADPAPKLEVLPEPVLKGFVHLPGILVTEADTALVIAQSRVKKGDFDPSDVVVTRSVDQGKTWSAPFKLHASADDAGYSCMLVEDRTTTPHTILAFYTVGPARWKEEQLLWYGRRSTDEGAAWSEPFTVKNDGAAASKPTNGGHGFQFPDGRLVIPGRKNFLTSDDHGASWTTRGTAETVETKAVPLIRGGGKEPNAVFLIARKSADFRIYDDRGEKTAEQGTHGVPYTTKGRNPGLAIYPPSLPGKANLLLMSGIGDLKERAFTITCSSDDGRTWSPGKQIDDKAWYSDIGVLKDGTILVAYTVNFSADLKIARLNLPWLLAK